MRNAKLLVGLVDKTYKKNTLKGMPHPNIYDLKEILPLQYGLIIFQRIIRISQQAQHNVTIT